MKLTKTEKTQMIIFVVIILFLYFAYVIKNTVVSVAADKVIETVIRQEAEKYDVEDSKVEEIIEMIEPEDKNEVNRIINNHLHDGMVETGLEILRNGSKEDLVNYAREVLTEEEKESVRQLYYKYADKISMDDVKEMIE